MTVWPVSAAHFGVFPAWRLRPNRFAARLAEGRMVVLSPDVAAVFPDADSVNAALRTLMQTAPASGRAAPGREA